MTETATPTRLDLRFVDGLRAISALAVALLHTYLFTGHEGQAERSLPDAFHVLLLGTFAVPVFIVLSGFVLMLPVARAGNLQLRGGTVTYLRRRARRILPPYYASLALFIAMIAAIPLLQHESNTAWDSKIPITWDGLLSHLLLVHNITPGVQTQINGPAWSVATEWQIYFALPLLLLPIWKRWGPTAMAATAIVAGLAIHLAIPQLDQAHLWFLGLFGMGMIAADLVARDVHIPYLGAVVATIGGATCIAMATFNEQTRSHLWFTESWLGVVVAGLLVWLGQRSLAGRRGWAHNLLESRFLVWVGLWSYSLYLIHSPLLALGNLILLDALDLPVGAQFAVMLLVVLPCALASAYLFHRLVERRFLTAHQKRVEID